MGKAVWDSVSAFANTNGGTMLLGPDEDAGFIPTQGVDANKTLDALDNLFYGQNPAIEPTPKVSFDRIPFEGHDVIAIASEPMSNDVELARRMPCFVAAKGIAKGSFKWVADEDKLLSAYEIYERQTRMRPNRSDYAVVEGATLADLNLSTVRALVDRLQQSGSRNQY